jgi:hypothetical protein
MLCMALASSSMHAPIKMHWNLRIHKARPMLHQPKVHTGCWDAAQAHAALAIASWVTAPIATMRPRAMHSRTLSCTMQVLALHKKRPELVEAVLAAMYPAALLSDASQRQDKAGAAGSHAACCS